MTKCPKCGGNGGVLMFTSIAPCDRCLSPEPLPLRRIGWVAVQDKYHLSNHSYTLAVYPESAFSTLVEKATDRNLAVFAVLSQHAIEFNDYCTVAQHSFGWVKATWNADDCVFEVGRR